MCKQDDLRIRAAIIEKGAVKPVDGGIRVIADPKAVLSQRRDHLTHDEVQEQRVRRAMWVLIRAAHRRSA